MRFRLSKLAYSDLDSIYAYTLAKWGREQADRYLGTLWDTFDKITAEPERHKVRDQLYPGSRICFAGRHAIIYRIRESRVEIARVLHDAMDFRRHLSSDFMAAE